MNISLHAFVFRSFSPSTNYRLTIFNPDNYPLTGKFHIFPYWSPLSWRSYNNIAYFTYPFTSVPRHVAFNRASGSSPLPNFFGLVVY